MAPTQSQKQNRQIYLTAILLGLLAGGLMLFFQKQSAPEAQCAGARAQLAAFATGEIAAFVPSKKTQALRDISFQDAAGKTHSLKEFYGKTILLNLWASWCVPCRREMPTLDRLQQKRGGNDFGVVALSMDTDGAAKAKKFLSTIKITSLPLYYDSDGAVFKELRKAGFVTGLPTSFMLDKNGCVLGTLAGPADWASDEALKLIDAAKKLTP